MATTSKRATVKGKYKKKQPKKVQPEPPKRQFGEVSCLGWCNGYLKPKFQNDRYCPACTKKKLERESGMSKREEGEINHVGSSIPNHFYPADY